MWVREDSPEQAALLVAAALGIAIESELRYEGVLAIEIAARLLASSGDAARAARLFGAADATRAVLGSPPQPDERAAREAAGDLIAARLAAPAVSDALAAGAALELTDAAREALAALAVFTGPEGA